MRILAPRAGVRTPAPRLLLARVEVVRAEGVGGAAPVADIKLGVIDAGGLAQPTRYRALRVDAVKLAPPVVRASLGVAPARATRALPLEVVQCLARWELA